MNDSIIEDTFEEQLKSEINMADILDKIPVDPVVVFGPDDEGKALRLAKKGGSKTTCATQNVKISCSNIKRRLE